MQEKIPFIALLFHSFPEAMILGSAGLIFLGVKPTWGKVVIYGIASAFGAYVLRQFGLQFAFLLMSLSTFNILILLLLFRLSLRKAIAAIVLATFLLLVFEGIALTVILQNTPLTSEMIIAPENAVLRVLVALPQMLLLATSAYIAYRLRGLHLDSHSSLSRYR